MTKNNRTSQENQILADLLFPNRIKNEENKQNIYDREYYEDFYLSKKRNVAQGSEILRMAPSPTGEFHTGALYMSLLNKIIAKKTNGIYILRIEDTDQKREVEGAKQKFVKFLNHYNLDADEGFVFDQDQTLQIGEFGPYLQSERQDIYEAFVYDLISKGYAYPCFMSEGDLIIMREEQESMKVRTGVYGKYAKHLNLTLDEIRAKITNGDKWIIRFNASLKSFENKIQIKDQFMGDLKLSDNDEHYVIYKSDKLPTYHLAHLIDDYLMGVTFVVRADEWIPSLTKHLQMWQILQETRSTYIKDKFDSIKIPKYGHLMPINMADGDSIRKLSKRKDKEASLIYFDVLGYTKESMIAYLLRLMAPTFDDWWRAGNRDVYNYDINLNELKRNSRGPILDMVKLNSFSSDLLGEMSAIDISERVLSWAQEYNIEFYNIIKSDILYLQTIMNIERGGDQPRKDIRHFSEIESNIFYFYDELFFAEDLSVKVDLKDYNDFIEKVKSDQNKQDKIAKIHSILNNIEYQDLFLKDNSSDNKMSLDNWIAKMKDIASQCQYDKFGEFMMDIRLIISKRKNTPNMYHIFEVMDNNMIINRFEKFINIFK